MGVRSLTEHLGSVEAIFSAEPAELRGAHGVGPGTAEAIVAQRTTLDLEHELELAERAGAHVVSFVDDEYPAALREIHDPPLALYVKGSLECRDRQAIAVVGTRQPSHYGRDTAEKLAFQLAKAGMVVASGLALGIDTAAHRGALKAKGRTLAVIGSGLNELYPSQNRELADEVRECGAVISEFPMDKAPDRTTFPMRNRIVSGLTLGTVVVEAGRRSGALITANQALEQGRTVFAVPGRIDSARSDGPHDLLRLGAKIVTTVEDILDEFDGIFSRRADGETAADTSLLPLLTEEEEKLVSLLTDGDAGVDALIRESGLSPARVNALLIGLEMKKVVRMRPGRIVELGRG